MVEPNVLILDDEDAWLYRHRGYLEDAGINCYATRLAKDAINAAKTNPAIKFAIIDEILYVPPVRVNDEDRELQRWQGHGVVREITAQRLDLKIIIVSSAPHLSSEASGGSNRAFREETKRLRRQKCVIDIIHKQDIEEDPDGSYDWILDLIKRPQTSGRPTTATPKMLLGLGFTEAEYAAMAEQVNMERKKILPMAPFFKMGSEAVLKSFLERAKEKTVWIEMPGARKPERVSAIKQGSSAFQILETLAVKSEKNQEVIIQEQEYQYSPRKAKKATADHAPSHDPLSVRDFAFEYTEEGGRRSRTGVQFEGRTEQTTRLKVAIHRLSQKLAKLNLGASRQLFDYKLDHRGYQPTFTLGIIVYAVKAGKTRRR
ncbi:MAG: hypothetical protein AAFV90_28875 [Cyanobacteria bacterium J06634_5]